MNITQTRFARSVALAVGGVGAFLTSTASAAPTRTEYRGSDSSNIYRMVLDVHQDPTSKVVIIDGGRVEFSSLANPYPIQQAGGHKVPKLSANQLAGVVVFSQANIGATATLFTGMLSGDISTGTIRVQNVRFNAPSGHAEDLSLALRPVGVSGNAGNASGGGSSSSGPLGSNVAGPGNGVGSPTGVNPRPVILPPGVANNIVHGRPGVASGAPAVPPPAANGNVGNTPIRLMDNSNTGGVTQVANPKRPSFFIYSPARVTEIWTYHWNNGRGAAPGTIALLGANGVTYGPWRAVGSAGSGNATNVNWTVHPNIVIPAGTYTVVDSSPGTWSLNTQSHDVGFARVEATH